MDNIESTVSLSAHQHKYQPLSYHPSGGSYAPGVTDRIKFVYDRTKLDLYWHFDSTSEKVIESPAMS